MNRPIRILMAEDNPADQEITRRVIADMGIPSELKILEDGLEVMNYLTRVEIYSDPEISPRPDFIMLDINMPRMNGKETLEAIKSNPNFRSIPVVMLTTSSYEKDIIESYELGVNAYITKPVDIGQFFTLIGNLKHFWFQIAELPPNSG
ncbi:MAG: response regulator [Spirochaetota bacterium]|nr:response regulator [Spirochaetota bacterium]